MEEIRNETKDVMSRHTKEKEERETDRKKINHPHTHNIHVLMVTWIGKCVVASHVTPIGMD